MSRWTGVSVPLSATPAENLRRSRGAILGQDQWPAVARSADESWLLRAFIFFGEDRPSIPAKGAP